MKRRLAPLPLILLLAVCGGPLLGSAGDESGPHAAGAQEASNEAATEVKSCRLTNSEASLDDLGRRFLEVLERGERGELAALAVQKEEFAECVYPTLPASQPGSNLSADFVWDQSSLRNLAGLSKTMDFAGRKFELVSLRIDGGTKDYGPFSIHRDGRLMVRDDSGSEFELDLFGSIIESGGRFKIHSFAH